MKVRAKFRVDGVSEDTCNPEMKTIVMSAVTSDDEGSENKSFWDYTPSGQIGLCTVNQRAAEQFVVGQEYYVDFTNSTCQKPTVGLSFGEAIEVAKNGFKIARAGWNGKNMWVAYMSGMSLPAHNCQEPGAKVNDRTAKLIGEDTPLITLPYLAMWTADKKWLPGWLASQTDMLADDWQIVD